MVPKPVCPWSFLTADTLAQMHQKKKPASLAGGGLFGFCRLHAHAHPLPLGSGRSRGRSKVQVIGHDAFKIP